MMGKDCKVLRYDALSDESLYLAIFPYGMDIKMN